MFQLDLGPLWSVSAILKEILLTSETEKVVNTHMTGKSHQRKNCTVQLKGKCTGLHGPIKNSRQRYCTNT